MQRLINFIGWISEKKKLKQNNYTIVPKPSGWFYSDLSIDIQI